jgi:hypothetical protein
MGRFQPMWMAAPKEILKTLSVTLQSTLWSTLSSAASSTHPIALDGTLPAQLAPSFKVHSHKGISIG